MNAPLPAQVTDAAGAYDSVSRAGNEVAESSCCGMAGSFGYEAKHHDVSMQMAELSLLPAVRAVPAAIVVADGTSCRHQIADGAQLLAGQLE